jgi:signal transduction histidine kinase
VFTRSLTQQLTDKLITLAQGAAANAEFENQRIKVESDFSTSNLKLQNQALQWFDSQGKLISQQGTDVLSLPFSLDKSVQMQAKANVQGVTLPIVDSDDHYQVIGYIRASQSLEDFEETLHKLDLGLGGGIAIALIFSSVGGVVLTRQAMQPIEKSFQRLQQFTADASHELRSPLMAIKSNAAVALKYSEGMRETDIQKFQAIASATNQMTRLTEDLLFLARNDKTFQQRENINLTLLLEDLVKLYQPQAVAKSIILKTQLNQNLYLSGDTVQLTHLFSNLIQNAIHYTQLLGTVEIIGSRVGFDIIVEVRDTGIGIAPEDINKVFERFYRADKSRSYWNSGSGLGLAIAQAIAHNHGGIITVSSKLKVGSCFSVRFSKNMPVSYTHLTLPTKA